MSLLTIKIIEFVIKVIDSRNFISEENDKIIIDIDTFDEKSNENNPYKDNYYDNSLWFYEGENNIEIIVANALFVFDEHRNFMNFTKKKSVSENNKLKIKEFNRLPNGTNIAMRDCNTEYHLPKYLILSLIIVIKEIFTLVISAR